MQALSVLGDDRFAVGKRRFGAEGIGTIHQQRDFGRVTGEEVVPVSLRNFDGERDVPALQPPVAFVRAADFGHLLEIARSLEALQQRPAFK